MANQEILKQIEELNKAIADAGILVEINGHSGIRHLYGSYSYDFHNELKNSFTSKRGRVDSSALHSRIKLKERQIKERLKKRIKALDFWPKENRNLILVNSEHVSKLGII